MKAKVLLIGGLMIAACAIASESPPPIPKTPAPIKELVLAQPFTLSKGYRYNWSKERVIVKSGTLVVLKVDPALVLPRNAAEPVLYAGDRTVQRLNHGHESGFVIGIVPGKIDLTKAPIWFGSPDLPERVGTEKIRAERAIADEANIRPSEQEKVGEARKQPLQLPNLSTLLREHAANLVLEYSPQEKKLAETWRLPVAKKNPKTR